VYLQSVSQNVGTLTRVYIVQLQLQNGQYPVGTHPLSQIESKMFWLSVAQDAILPGPNSKIPVRLCFHCDMIDHVCTRHILCMCNVYAHAGRARPDLK
jgi:hypothetical protein